LLHFGLDLQSTRDTASTIGWLTGGIRIHHGCCGLMLLVVALMVLKRFPRFGGLLVIVGLALIFSDAIHHFLVLWPITGSPQFDLVYPD
jgi:hypothetical protein